MSLPGSAGILIHQTGCTQSLSALLSFQAVLSFPIAFPDSSVSVTSPVLWPSPTTVPSMGIACLGIQFPTGSHESGFEDTYRHFKVEPPVAPGAKRAAVAAIYRFESIVVCSCLLHGVLCRLSRLCSAKCGPRNFLGLSTCWMRHRHETDDSKKCAESALCSNSAVQNSTTTRAFAERSWRA